MVTVVDVRSMENEQEEIFFGLVVQGGVEPVKSSQTGRIYFTAKKVTVPTTFDEQTCKSLVGTQLPGHVKKIECDPYDYTVAETGEILRLSHRYEYITDEMAIVSANLIEKEMVL